MLRDNVQPLSIPMKQDANGILLFLDRSRSKYLSTSREVFTFGINHKNLSAIMWLMATGRVRTITTGYKIPRNATITSVTVQTTNTVTNASFNILRNNTTVPPLTTLTLLGQVSASVDNLNININKDDWLQCRLIPVAGVVNYPLVVLELAWRE